jgi:hypothetical protein
MRYKQTTLEAIYTLYQQPIKTTLEALCAVYKELLKLYAPSKKQPWKLYAGSTQSTLEGYMRYRPSVLETTRAVGVGAWSCVRDGWVL